MAIAKISCSLPNIWLRLSYQTLAPSFVSKAIGRGIFLATAPIYQSSQLVAISPISTSVKLSNLNHYVFRTVPSDYIAARALAQYMLEQQQQTRVAVFYNSQSNYSQSLKSEFVTAVSLGGGRVTKYF